MLQVEGEQYAAQFAPLLPDEGSVVLLKELLPFRLQRDQFLKMGLQPDLHVCGQAVRVDPLVEDQLPGEACGQVGRLQLYRGDFLRD